MPRQQLSSVLNGRFPTVPRRVFDALSFHFHRSATEPRPVCGVAAAGNQEA